MSSRPCLSEGEHTSFEAWSRMAEPRLAQAFIAEFGALDGKEAAAEAVSFAWERWDDLAHMENPTGYVFVSVRRRVRRHRSRRQPAFRPVPTDRLPHVEPGLPGALEALSSRQRQAVGLVHGYGWTMTEVAELLGLSKSSVQNHVERGMAKLRRQLGVEA